jgi:hypothetical protein
MTTRKGMVVGAVLMAVLAPAAGMAQMKDDSRFTQEGRQSTHCEGAYDESQGTNFAVCYSSVVGDESKSPIGELPEAPGSSE